MSYTPINWQTGDQITAARLNAMDQGIANAGVLVVHSTNNTLDKTWQEIHDSPFSVLWRDGSFFLYMGAFEEDGEYFVGYWVFGGANPLTFITNSASGYPTLDV